MRTPSLALGALLAFVASTPAPAVELQFYFSALQRILSEQWFTQDGRLYVRGDRRNQCNFAFLERPVISTAGDLLRIDAHFSGRSAQSFFGRCIGMADSFDVQIVARPQYRDGSLALSNVHVESPGRDSFYVRRVRASMADSLNKQFKYNLAADAKRILEEPKPNSPIRQELRQFDVREIRVLPDSVIFVLDFRLAVR